MLVRYRMNSTCTLADMQADIDNLIIGNITSVNDFSSGCDKTNSVIYGTYPTGTYARVNGTTYTYSKTHNDATTSKTHYFRLTYDATKLTSINLAQSYTSGTDTLVNSTSKTVNITPFTYNVNAKYGIDIIINNKMLTFFAITSGAFQGVVDIGHNASTRAYANSALMVLQDYNNVPTYGANTGCINPYIWNYATGAYGSSTSGIQGPKTARVINGSTQVIFENPAFVTLAGASSLLYGTFQVPASVFAGLQVYKDAANLYRVTLNDLSILAD